MFYRVYLALLVVAISSVGWAESLADVLRKEIPNSPAPPFDTRHAITSYAVLNDASNFGIAYYEVNKLRPQELTPPIHVLLYDKSRMEWKGTEFQKPEIGSIRHHLSHDCAGSVLRFQRAAEYYMLETHLNPSASCSLFLTPELKVQRSFYGFLRASLSSEQVIMERNEIHFAPTHPLGLVLLDLKTGHEARLLPQPDDGVRNDFMEDLGNAQDETWCRSENASCDPERVDGTMLKIETDEQSHSAAMLVNYSSTGFGPKAEQIVGDADVIYVFDLSDGQVRHRELRVDVFRRKFGTIDLEEILRPAMLHRVFADAAN